MLKMDLGSFGASVYVFARDERGGWTEDWEEIDNRIVRGGRCDVQQVWWDVGLEVCWDLWSQTEV